MLQRDKQCKKPPQLRLEKCQRCTANKRQPKQSRKSPMRRSSKLSLPPPRIDQRYKESPSTDPWWRKRIPRDNERMKMHLLTLETSQKNKAYTWSLKQKSKIPWSTSLSRP